MSRGGFEKHSHISGNLEGLVYTQGCVYVQVVHMLCKDLGPWLSPLAKPKQAGSEGKDRV